MTDWLEHVAIRRSAVGLLSLDITYKQMISLMRGRVLICQLPRLAIHGSLVGLITVGEILRL